MKRQINRFKANPRIISLALCAALCGAGAAFGQAPGDGQNQENGPGGNRPPPRRMPPVIQALDTNHDGIIDPDEIANAAQSLKTLLKSGSTQLTIEDLLGPPPHGRRPPGQDQGNPGGPPDTQPANPGAQNSPPPQNGQGGPDGNGGPGNDQNSPPGPPPDQNGPGASGGPGGHHRPPLPPVIQALDTNHDGIIDADEIANAAQSLKTLLKSGSTQLTIKDLLGPPPRWPRPRGEGQGNNQYGPPGPPPDQDGPGGPPPPPDASQSGSNGQTGAPPPPPPQ